MLDFDRLRASWRVRGGALRRDEAKYRAKLQLLRLFLFLKRRLGAHEARLFLVRSAAQLPAKKSRGPSDSALNAGLCDLLEAALEQGSEKASLPRQLAEWLHQTQPGEYGNSAAAIEKHLRRLAREFDQRNEDLRIMREILGEGEVAIEKLRRDFADK